MSWVRWNDTDKRYQQSTDGGQNWSNLHYRDIVIEDGTVSAPSLTFDADPDTGFYRIGANSLGFVTGGYKRFQIDANGYVGIGTTAPKGPLHVEVASGVAVFDYGTTLTATQLSTLSWAYGGVVIGSNNANTYNALAIGGRFRAYGVPTGVITFNEFGTDESLITTTGALIGGLGDTTTATDNGMHLTFQTKVTGGGLTERVRITSAGNVGIGTTAPNAKLDILHQESYEAAGTEMQRWGHVGGTYSWYLSLVQAWPTSGEIRYDFIQTRSGTPSNMLTFLNGNVGIGTTAPSARLTVLSASPDAPYSGLSVLSGAAAWTGISVGRTTPDFWIGVGRNNDYLAGSAAGDAMMVHTGRLLFGQAISGAIQAQFDASGNFGLAPTLIATYRMQAAQDVTNDGDITYGQLALTGATDTGKRLVLGYETNSGYGYGYIKAGKQGYEWRPLMLAFNGGDVGVGNMTIPANGSGLTFKLQTAGSVGPSTTLTYNLGSASYRWHNGYIDHIFENGRTYALGSRQSYTPTVTASAGSLTVTTATCQYTIIGEMVIAIYDLDITPATAGTNPTTFSVTLPVNSGATPTGGIRMPFQTYVMGVGDETVMGKATIGASASSATLYRLDASNWTYNVRYTIKNTVIYFI